jgi:dihydrofolate reductase
MIVAVSQNGLIGDTEHNSLLWNIPEDLSRFSKMTSGHIVIMGHKTFWSLPNGKLKNRINIVLTRTPPVLQIPIPEENKNIEDDLFFVDISRLWTLLNRFVYKKVFVIGGGSIYKLLYPFCSRVHYTLVDLEPSGDVMFPFSREWLKRKSNNGVEEGEWNISISGARYKYITYNIKH